MNHIKIIKKLIREGYNLKAQHHNKKWREALEEAEDYIIKQKNK